VLELSFSFAPESESSVYGTFTPKNENVVELSRNDCALQEQSILIQLDCIITIRNLVIYISKKP